MTSGYRTCWPTRLGWALGIALIPALLWAAGKSDGRADPAQAERETVEMWQAIEDGQIDVKLIPRDSKLSNVLIENKTQKPLHVQLPDAFAGVPVLAQMGMGGMGGMGGGGMGGMGGGGMGGGGQGMGGGMGGMGGGGMGGGGMGGGGMGGGFFNVPPEKVGKFQVTTVCLEHGKAEPRPAMKYEIKPIHEFTDKAEVHELCRMLGYGQVDQRSAQVAAWHLNSEMSWQELIAKQLKFANGLARPYFSQAEIRRAMGVVSAAKQLAEQRALTTDQPSLSQR